MNVRSFLSSFKAFYRFLISTCFVAHLDSLSAENMIHDCLISSISSLKVFFKSLIAVYHSAQLVHFFTQNIILSSKTSPLSI